MAHHAFLQRSEISPDADVGIRISRREVPRDSVHISPRLLHAHTWLKAAERVKSEACTTTEQRRIVPLSDGHIHLALTETDGCQTKARRNYSDNGVAATIQGDALPQNVRRRIEFALPQAFADQRHGCGADWLFVSGKGTANHRLHPKQTEELG